MNLEQLKCIKVVHTMNGEHVSTTMISWEQFESAFVRQRWSGERRFGKVSTIFGIAHKRTTVRFEGMLSVRVFEFPASREDAFKKHQD